MTKLNDVERGELAHAVALGDLVVQMHGLRQREEGPDALELLFPAGR